MHTINDGKLEPGFRKGVVKRFFKREERQYGFIAVDGGKDVFFHIKNFSIPEIDGYVLEWAEPWFLREIPERIPKEGEIVYFEVIEKGRGPAASNWTYKEYYETAADSLFCPCGHHSYNHLFGEYCGECECQSFGEPTENWEEFNIINVDGKGGFEIIE